MENFLKETKKMKKIKTGELAALIYESQDTIIADYIKKSYSPKFKDTLDKLYERMSDPKFPAAIKKILKRGKKEEDIKLDCGFAVVINGFIEYNAKAEHKVDDEIISEYIDIIDKLLSKQAKKLAKSLDLDTDVVREILVVAPSKDYISNEKFVGIYSQRMLRKFYVMSANADKPLGLATTKQVKKLFAKIFGKDLLDVIAVNVLLEKREYMEKYNESQTAVWNLMTQFAVDVIESQDKKHVYELVKYYIDRRRRDDQHQRDAARRISLAGLPAEDYPRIAKAVSKFKNGKLNKYL